MGPVLRFGLFQSEQQPLLLRAVCSSRQRICQIARVLRAHSIHSDSFDLFRMASYEQVVRFENEKPQGVIRLVEANGFYRAYNHSAFLFHQVIAQHKVTRKFVKNINAEVVYIGFPVDKLLERIGERKHQKTEFGYDVELSPSEMPDDAEYDEWRVTIPTEPASRGDVNALGMHGDELCRAVCARIRSFPMETKSLVESVSFLADIKKVLSEERGK